MNTKKTILFVAMGDSIHTARWINQISDQGWEVHLFPCVPNGAVHPEIRNVTVHHFIYTKPCKTEDRVLTIRNHGIFIPLNPGGFVSLFISAVGIMMHRYFRVYRIRQLRRLIKQLKPDVIHSLEFQHAGYLTLQALHSSVSMSFWNMARFLFKKIRKMDRPMAFLENTASNTFMIEEKRIVGGSSRWIATNWGSDIYLFGRLTEHAPKIRQVLAACDYYSCECRRDVALAKSYGFTGKVLPVFPNTGGFDLEKVSKLRQHGLISERRLIMLKGYQGWAYRGLVGLRALERCADLLKGYTVAIYLVVTPEMKIAAELFMQSTGIPVMMIPYVSHDEMLRYHGQARVSIGVNISDSISTSFLEALVMGSFPIQTYTSCANEWIEDGKTGILIPPEDPDVIEKAIRRALTDDDLVNRAAELNWKTVVERLDHNELKAKTIEFYKRVTES